MIGKFAIGLCSRCHGCENGISYDGYVSLFRRSNVKYTPVTLMKLTIDILLGVGVSGLFMNLTTEPEYRISISPTLLVSTISLFITLSSILIVVPLNKWRMTRVFGICLVIFFIISTITSIVVEILN